MADEQPSQRIPPPVHPTPWIRPAVVCLFLAAFLSLACLFHPERGWNVNTRLALVMALVDQRTFSIDDYHDSPELETNDKAVFEGHYYSDKIFGVSLLALPAYAATRLAGAPFGWRPTVAQTDYILRLWSVSLPAAVSVVLAWLLMIRIGAAPRRAMVAIALFFWGSHWFGFASIFMPYAPGIAASLGALYLILFPPARRITARNSLGIGLLLGFSLLCDLTFGLVSGAVGVVYLLRLVDQGGFYGMRAFASMSGDRTTGKGCLGLLAVQLAGVALPLLLFAAYTIAIFGKPAIPYEYEASAEFREGMARGVMGVTSPKLAPLWFITFHPYRGFFFWNPLAVLAVAGLVMGTKSSGKRRIVGWLGLWALGAYLLFNAGYYQWWGGFSMGSRLLLPMMVAVPLGLAELCRRDRHRAWWWAVVGIGILSVAMSFPLSFQDPQTPQGNQADLLYGATLSTRIAIPQFVYWKQFFIPDYYRFLDTGDYDWGRIARLAGAIVAPLVLLGLAWRKLPEKHLPFERLEVPAVNFDGNAAPLPTPLARRPGG